MINTKLILVDGITGSGKSTTAHYIYRQLIRNGIKAKWFYEQDRDHPIGELDDVPDETDQEYLERLIDIVPKKWNDLIEIIKNDDSIYIIESYLFQDILFELIGFGLDRVEIKKHAHKLYDQMKTLNSVAIHFTQLDTEKHQRNNWVKRGEYFKEGIIEETDNTPYCKDRNLSGEEGAIKLWNELADLSKEMFEELDFKKIQIDITEQKWDDYRKKVIGFLDIDQFEEVTYKDEFEEYLGKYEKFVIHEKDGSLYLDTFHPNIKLIPTEQDLFEIEGFPISIRFNRDESGKVVELEIVKALCYFEEGRVKRKG